MSQVQVLVGCTLLGGIFGHLSFARQALIKLEATFKILYFYLQINSYIFFKSLYFLGRQKEE
jgi:hypothetical protein